MCGPHGPKPCSEKDAFLLHFGCNCSCNETPFPPPSLTHPPSFFPRYCRGYLSFFFRTYVRPPPQGRRRRIHVLLFLSRQLVLCMQSPRPLLRIPGARFVCPSVCLSEIAAPLRCAEDPAGGMETGKTRALKYAANWTSPMLRRTSPLLKGNGGGKVLWTNNW